LVALIRAGDERAFEAVYERYHRQLLSFSRHMLANTDDAAEAVQQTFLSAYRDLTTSSKQIQLKPWLFTIARNRCLSILRARREHADVDVVEPATEGLAAEVQRREDLRELLGDLSRLPEDQRAALVLAELGSLAHDEIGDVVGCSREKVKALVFQARSSLAASRQARATSCEDIRRQLATLRGAALRRATLRRHVRECPGCQAFDQEVRRQRQAFALILPVAPVAGLKEAVLSGSGIAGGVAATTAGAGGGAAAGLGALGVKSLGTKLLLAAVILGGGTAGGVVVAGGVGDDSPAARGSDAAPGASARSASAELSSMARVGVKAAATVPVPAGAKRAHKRHAGRSSSAHHKAKTHGGAVTATEPSSTSGASPGAKRGSSKRQNDKPKKAPANLVPLPAATPAPQSQAPLPVGPKPSSDGDDGGAKGNRGHGHDHHPGDGDHSHNN
jgi:RNA polymerase sigma factor (sigma-70 family)